MLWQLVQNYLPLNFITFFNITTPIARARINGTVIAPVVAPEASKDIAKNSFDVNIASIQIKEYKIVNIFLMVCHEQFLQDLKKALFQFQ